MLRNKSLILLILPWLFWSCDKKEESPDKVIWGSTDYYESFMFKKYEPVIMKQTLEFDFNDDAKRLIDGFIEFEPVVKNENNEIEIAKGIILYKNSEKCENNILKIKPDEQSIELGIEFTGEANEGSHTIYLRVKNANGLDRIDDTEISMAENIVLAHEWVVKKDNVYNPLLFGLMWLAIIVLVTCFAWIVFLKPLLFESFKVQRLIITTDHFKSIKIKGCKQVICTNKKQKQTFINKLFTGRIVFVPDEFFTIDLIITPRDKKTVRVKTPQGFETTSNLLNIGETLAIKNALVTPNTTATMQIN